MTTVDDRVVLVQRLFGAMTSGDFESARALITDDLVWTIPGSSPIAGDHRGPDAVFEQVRMLFGAGLQVELLDVLAGEDHVATVQRNSARQGDRRLDILVVNVFRLRDGRLAEWRTFPSDQGALDRFWGG